MRVPASVSAVPIRRERVERRDARPGFDTGSGELFRSPVGAAASTIPSLRTIADGPRCRNEGCLSSFGPGSTQGRDQRSTRVVLASGQIGS